MDKKKNSFLQRLPVAWKWTFGVLIILIAVTIAVGAYWKAVISNKIKDAVSKSTMGLYTLDFSDMHFKLFSGGLAFDSVSLKPDTSVFNRMRNTGDAPRHLFDIGLSSLIITDLSPLDIYFKKKLHLNVIVLDKPVIKVFYNEFKTRDLPEEVKTAYQQISGFLNSVIVKDISIKDAGFKYIDNSYSIPDTTEFKGLTVKVTDLRIDSLAQFDKSRFYYTKEIFVQLKNYRHSTKNTLYNISIGEIAASTSGKYLMLRKFSLKPRYPEMEFSRHYKYQHDRYDLFFDKITLNDIDFARLNSQRRLLAGKLSIEDAVIKIFMNRELPPVTFDKGRNYPHVVLKRLKINTRIDTLLIKRTGISYSEFNPDSKRKGTVTFNKFNASILNVTNDSLSLARNHWARATTSALLMNKGLMNVRINFDLTSATGGFDFNGSLGKMDMRVLNPLSRNMSLAKIESGMITKATFSVAGNLHNTSGSIRLYYNDLKVELLKRDDDTGKLKDKTLVSSVANILVKDDNPGDDGKLRIGKTSATRLSSASFFNLMWKSLFAGMKESIGLTLESTDKVKVEPSKKEQRKLKRKLRREKRKDNN